MKKIIAAGALTLFCAATALAAGPETITLPAKMGNVTFAHKAHQERLKGECTKCHATKEGGKIEGFNKEKAHALCQTCHKENKKGPTKCTECHKK